MCLSKRRFDIRINRFHVLFLLGLFFFAFSIAFFSPRHKSSCVAAVEELQLIVLSDIPQFELQCCCDPSADDAIMIREKQ